MIKRMVSFFFLVLSTIVTLTAFSSAPNKQPLDEWIDKAKKSIQKKVLHNGMTVLFYPVSHTCVVDISTTVNIGSRHEHDRQFGLAHMVEHMIFKGTKSMSEVDLKRIAQKFGNTIWNASTSMDQTSYFFQTDNKNWNIFLSILADCMSNVRFDEDHFASEVKTVISELNLNRASPVRKMVDVVLHNSFNLGHPYHHLTIGRREDLINSSAQDLKDFYHAYYTPEKTVLTIVGNIEAEKLFEKIDEYFGSVPPTQNQLPQIEYDPEAFLPTDFIQKNSIIHTQTKNACTMLYWIVPGQKNPEATIANEVCYILDERLKKLKDTHDLVYTSNAFMAGFFDAGIFGYSFEPKTERIDHIRILIENEIHDLIHTGPTDNEMTQLKLLERNNFVNGFEDINIIAEILKSYCLNNNEYEIFDRFDQIQALTKQDIKNFCKNYLCPNLCNSVSCIPLQEKEKAGWTAMQEKIDTYEKKLLNKKNRQTPLEEEWLLEKLPEPELLDIDFQQPDCTATLSNGLTVYIKQRTHAPGMVLSCSFYNPEQIAIYHDLKNQSLIPALLMSLLNEASLGTDSHPEEFSKKEHAQFFDSLGAEYSLSAAGAILHCLPYDLEMAASRLLHILTMPVFPQESFCRVVHNTIQKIMMNKDDTCSRANSHLMQHLYQAYPWTKTDEQLIENLKSHTRQDLYASHQQLVSPHTMYLTLVGNIDPDDAIQRLENIFGAWTNDDFDLINSITIPKITNPASQDITIPLPKEQVTLLAGRLTTVRATDEGRALLLIEGYLNQILYNIRERTGLFYGCHARLAPSSFTTVNNAYILTTITPDNVEQTKAEIKAALQSLCDDGIPQQYLTIAKQNYRADIAKSFATNNAYAKAYNSIIANDKTFNYFHDQADNIDNLTLEQVNAVAGTYCDPTTWTFIQAGRVENNATT